MKILHITNQLKKIVNTRQRTFCLSQDELIDLMNNTPSLSTYSSQVNDAINVGFTIICHKN